MPNENNHPAFIKKREIEDKYGSENVAWGNETSESIEGEITNYLCLSEKYSFFKEKFDELKNKLGIDIVIFFKSKNNPTEYNLFFNKITIEHYETINTPFGPKKIYFKRSYRYYMAIKKSENPSEHVVGNA